eukprot:CAMPEP_0181284816 /NCGR_PEP_ID=MMETSP1097-20121128/15624_1 /TAXON_ID=35684 /ORGANISM="Pseudopedinella elastica, Strain CCMP716" /LENGTH=51 /DNA_ID=CAMNT_0023388313 /DNA_START=81 /DNA_END=236 /DNA_ORIENTATION=+
MTSPTLPVSHDLAPPLLASGLPSCCWAAAEAALAVRTPAAASRTSSAATKE